MFLNKFMTICLVCNLFVTLTNLIILFSTVQNLTTMYSQKTNSSFSQARDQKDFSRKRSAGITLLLKLVNGRKLFTLVRLLQLLRILCRFQRYQLLQNLLQWYFQPPSKFLKM